MIPDTKSGLSPKPLAQVPVQAKVLCSQQGSSSLEGGSSCSINITQLQRLDQLNLLNPLSGLRPAPSPNQTVFFEAMVAFKQYPWPQWKSIADASQDIVVNNGDVPLHIPDTCNLIVHILHVCIYEYIYINVYKYVYVYICIHTNWNQCVS